MKRLPCNVLAALLLAPLTLLASCSSTGHGTTEVFAESAPTTVFVLAPRPDEVIGEEAELVRVKLMRALRKKGYGVTSAADATLIPTIEVWASQTRSNGSSRDTVTISARLIDRQERLLWEDTGSARSEQDEQEEGDIVDGLIDATISNATGRWSKRRARLAEEAVHDLLRSLPEAPKR